MKTNKKNIATQLQGNGSVNAYKNYKYYTLDAKSFLVYTLLVMVLCCGATIDSLAQKKGVWGNFSSPQKFGETYSGIITGTESTPTGFSSLTHISPNSAIHSYYGIEGTLIDISKLQNGYTSVFGILYQPRVSFRTGNLNCGYYVSIGGQLAQNRSQERISENGLESRKEVHRTQQEAVVLGAGVFLELHHKWHIFVEKNGKIQNNSNEPIKYYDSAGIRFFIF